MTTESGSAVWTLQGLLDLFDVPFSGRSDGDDVVLAETGLAGQDDRQVVEGTQVLAQAIVAVAKRFPDKSVRTATAVFSRAVMVGVASLEPSPLLAGSVAVVVSAGAAGHAARVNSASDRRCMAGKDNARGRGEPALEVDRGRALCDRFALREALSRGASELVLLADALTPIARGLPRRLLRSSDLLHQLLTPRECVAEFFFLAGRER